jgi:hypothetical protein
VCGGEGDAYTLASYPIAIVRNWSFLPPGKLAVTWVAVESDPGHGPSASQPEGASHLLGAADKSEGRR